MEEGFGEGGMIFAVAATNSWKERSTRKCFGTHGRTSQRRGSTVWHPRMGMETARTKRRTKDGSNKKALSVIERAFLRMGMVRCGDGSMGGWFGVGMGQ
jgi:hypothetical protein